MDKERIKGYTHQLCASYFVIALNVVSAFIFVMLSSMNLDLNMRLTHAGFHGIIDIINIVMLFYLQPWKIAAALWNGFEYKRGFEAVKGAKDAD